MKDNKIIQKESNYNLSTITRPLSNTLYVYKAFAIVLVVFAHCSYNNNVVNRISALLGTLGVPIFFAVSGFFANLYEDRRTFWIKKLNSIVIPYLIWGVITYLISVVLMHKAIGMLELTKWILGNGTWLYFVPMLLFCFLIFRISQSKLYLGIIFVLFILSNVLTVASVIDGTKWISEYQFVFNWCGFFEIGVISRAKIDRLCNIKLSWIVRSMIVLVWAVIGIVYIKSMLPTYFTPFSVIYEFFSLIAVYYIAELFANNILIREIGKNTYLIFFLHMQIGMATFNILAKLMHITQYEYLILVLKPVSIVILVFYGIQFARYILKKAKMNKIMKILGL